MNEVKPRNPRPRVASNAGRGGCSGEMHKLSGCKARPGYVETAEGKAKAVAKMGDLLAGWAAKSEKVTCLGRDETTQASVSLKKQRWLFLLGSVCR